MESWQNSEENAAQIIIFLPRYMWAENNKRLSLLRTIFVTKFSPKVSGARRTATTSFK